MPHIETAFTYECDNCGHTAVLGRDVDPIELGWAFDGTLVGGDCSECGDSMRICRPPDQSLKKLARTVCNHCGQTVLYADEEARNAK